jgi:hypothetical protein
MRAQMLIETNSRRVEQSMSKLRGAEQEEQNLKFLLEFLWRKKIQNLKKSREKKQMSLNDTILEGDVDFRNQQNYRGKNNMSLKRKTVNVALVCHKHDYTYDEPGRVRSGHWKIGEHKRKELIGTTVILTESQTSPAYLGGKIVELIQLGEAE